MGSWPPILKKDIFRRHFFAAPTKGKQNKTK